MNVGIDYEASVWLFLRNSGARELTNSEDPGGQGRSGGEPQDSPAARAGV